MTPRFSRRALLALAAATMSILVLQAPTANAAATMTTSIGISNGYVSTKATCVATRSNNYFRIVMKLYKSDGRSQVQFGSGGYSSDRKVAKGFKGTGYIVPAVTAPHGAYIWFTAVCQQRSSTSASWSTIGSKSSTTIWAP